MAEEAGAAPAVMDQEEQFQEQVEAAPVEAGDEANGGAKKREREEEAEEGEPDAKRPNTNGEEEPAAAAEGHGNPEADPVGAAEDADPPVANSGDDDCPGPGPAAAAAAAVNDPPAGENAATDNPGPAGGNPGPGATEQQPQDDREYTTYPDGQVSEVMHVPKTLIGKLIGKAGSTIMGLQTQTGCSIQVDQTSLTRGGECRRVTIKGLPSAVENAKAQVEATISDTPAPAGGGAETSADVHCPPGIVGRIIGRAGETIKLLQGASGAYILVNQNFPEGEDRLVTITGNQDAVNRASNMVRDLIANDQVSVQSVIQKYGLGKTIKLQCPRSAVGRIIGRGGETVKMLQRKYSASVQINQTTDPMDVTIIATPQDAEACQAEILNIIAHPEVPSGGGMGPGMGMGMGMGMGGGYMGRGPMGGMGPRPGFGMPYGGAPFGGMPYGGGTPYGGYAAPYGGGMPAYGAFGGYGQMPGYGGGMGGGAGVSGGYDTSAYGAQAAQGQQQQYGGGAPAAAAPAASSVWQAIPDDQGRTYYYNTQTGVSQWEKPAEMP